MLRQSARSSRSLALSLALGVVAVAGVTGCGASDADNEDPIGAPDVQSRKITMGDLEALQPGQFLDLDLMSSKTVYQIDYTKPSDDAASMDYSRIKLVFGQDKSVVLETQVAALESGIYGNNQQPNLRSNHDNRFAVAANESYFGELSESQLEQLRADGYFYSQSPAAPGASPQSTDDCIHAVCEICVDNETGANPVSWLPGTYTCYFIEHVWC